ncbi:50S ribosomal protein L14, putative [Ricinus communis]|uniref:50S ribosomal protein L14, putative n=1 Tax=Ricinus communis TaxID=3988 RepID=B9S1B7_RICCO|nr:50S ribosomal protein L14, putative [Ricinus communis]
MGSGKGSLEYWVAVVKPDNSGARDLMCIRIIGTSNHRYAHIGDVIVAMIKEVAPNSPLERSEVIRAVILSLIKKEIQRELEFLVQSPEN